MYSEINIEKAKRYAKERLREKQQQILLSQDKALTKFQSECPKGTILLKKLRRFPMLIAFSKTEKETVDLQKEESLLKSQLEELLASHNLTFAQITKKHYCEKCKDTAVFQGAECDCFKFFVNEYFAEALGSGNYTMSSPPEHLKEKYEKAGKFLTAFPKTEYHTMVFTGKTGTGKTFLAKAILLELAKRGYYQLGISAYDLVSLFNQIDSSFKSFYEKDKDWGRETLSTLYEMDALLIDDLGAEKEVKENHIINLMEHRQTMGKVTIFTTNLTDVGIKEIYGERFLSKVVNTKKTRTLSFLETNLRGV